MDGQRLDEISKALASGASRRTVIRTALGGIGAGVLALIGSTDVDAARSRRNRIDVDELRACIRGCKQLSGLERGQCISACARGVDERTGTQCGANVCGPEQYCCNESCGICAPIGGFCTQEFCGPS